MDRDRLLAEFDVHVRAQPMGRRGLVVDRDDGVVRLTGAFNFISSWSLTRETAAGAVARQAAHFRGRGEDLRWRVYGHDLPKELPAFLAENGFRPSPPGTLMFMDLAEDLCGAPPDGVAVTRVRSESDLDAFVEASDAAFPGGQATRQRAVYADNLDDDRIVLFLAWIGDVAVASARLDLAGGPFGMLYGGGVAPAYRGRGAYRALVAARVAEARRRGVKYLGTEARETSRPILEQLGFAPFDSETTWELDLTSGSPA
jgi:GNAT superfamily N-acetyltransferase